VQSVDVGETEIVTTAWWDDDGNAVEPATIDLTITKPDGSLVSKTKADMSQGATIDVWTYDQVVDDGGVWRVSATGTVGSREVKQSSLFLAGTTSFGVAPCEPWATWAQVENICPTTNFAELPSATKEQLLDVATGILWSLDGRRYPGICTTTRRVCRACQTCVTGLCCCSPRGAIDLGTRWPAWGVLDVVVDGVTLPPSAYGLRDRRWLDRLDGEPWPSCRALTDPDAFVVTWALGRRPPVELSDAAAVFAGEMGKSCLGVTCEIPQRVVSIVREGVTFTILDSQKFLDEGRVGIYRVDLALKAAKQGREVKPGMSSPLRRQRTSRP
jgi:hypothetical protein